MNTYTEPTDRDVAIIERHALGLCPFGPLTRDEHAIEQSYAEHMAALEAEHEAEQAAGGRTICPDCGGRTVTHRAVLTYGVPSHPEAEYSSLAECDVCGFRNL